MAQPSGVGASVHRDLGSHVRVVAGKTPLVVNDDTEGTGTGCDLKGFESCVAFAHVGISGDTLSGSVKIAPKLQESDDNSTFTDVAAADRRIDQGNLNEIDDAAEDDLLIQVTYLGSKRYLRWFFDMTGTHTNGTPIYAGFIKGHPRVAPAA